jgi:hypothetical protein
MKRLRLILFLVLAAFCFSMVTPSPAEARQPQPAQWYDGGIQYSSITNCVSIIQGFPYEERGAGAFVGFFGQPTSSLPAPNTTYYIHIYVAGLGNSCSGQRFFADVALPPTTALAIDGVNPVLCYTHLGQVTGADCPQTLPPSSWNPGAFALYSTDNAHANLWPLPQGGHWEFLIPVRSTTTLTSATLQANVWVLDGNSSPWLRPTQGVFVFAAGQPTILYETPSTINIATTTARSEVFLYTHSSSVTGTGNFQLGTTTAYGLINDPVTVPGGSAAYLAWDEWDPVLQPDTLYHWRFTFTPTGGSTVVGADQTFRTLPDGKQTVGSGTAGSCTEAAFTSKFNIAGTKQIVFDCGALPVTIPFTSTRTISTPTFTTLLIDGGSKVTLQRSGSGNHFAVTSGATLTLKGITLTNGTATCGGAVNVSSGASLILDDARFLSNQAFSQGGAVCNNGTTTATNSLFSGNLAGTHGGAIGNYSTLTVTNSKFLNNSANTNGGGIDSVGSLTVTGSTFGGNAAGFRGGGINSFVGTLLSISNSSFLTNTAGLYGGGVASDGPAATTITGSTFSANSSANFGGAIEMSGTGSSFTLTNSTLTDNTAVSQGGGVWWNPPSNTATLDILNSTIADNVAGGTGGNIHTGMAGLNALISLKNSIVSGGIPSNCSGTVVTAGFNLESTNTCGFAAGGDKPNVAANLGPLLKNAGTTMTRLPLPGSQAIDGGTNTGCPATDQQGVSRTRDGDGNGSSVCDIGATELLFPAATITRINPDGGPTAGGQVVTITGTNLSGATVTIGGIPVFVGSSTATTATVLTQAHAAGPVNVVVTGAIGGAVTAVNGYTYFPLVGPPTITATATSGTAVALSWPASSGAASYEVWRSSQGGGFNMVLSTPGTSTSDTGLTADTTYLYKVRAINGANTSGFSLVDAATTVVFTDAASLVGLPIKAVHLTQLRTAVNAMMVAAGLDAKFFTNGTLSVGSTRVSRLHLVELRAALNVARSALGLAPLVFTDATLTAGATTIKGIHVSEVRAGTQ